MITRSPGAVLVACEESQAVTIALRNEGIEAYSCDIVPCSGIHPEWHLQQDVIPLLQEEWGAIIAFPPCTDLAVSGARWFKEKRANGQQQKSIDFFLAIATAPCEQIAIENPVGIMSRLYRKPDQIIQPWMFGHMESKATCLWLKGLPPLQETANVYEAMMQLPLRERTRIHYASPGPDRAMLRSKTYPGIAAAMAHQWRDFLTTKEQPYERTLQH